MWPLPASLLGLLPAAILIGIVWTIRSRLDRSERRDPITPDLRHLPGSGLLAALLLPAGHNNRGLTPIIRNPYYS